MDIYISHGHSVDMSQLSIRVHKPQSLDLILLVVYLT